MRHVLDFLLLLAFSAILSGAIAGQLDPPAPRPSPRQDSMTTIITDSTNDGRFAVRLDILSRKDGLLPDDPTSIHIEVTTYLAEDIIGAIQVEHWPVSGRRIIYLTPSKRDLSVERVLGDAAAVPAQNAGRMRLVDQRLDLHQQRPRALLRHQHAGAGHLLLVLREEQCGGIGHAAQSLVGHGEDAQLVHRCRAGVPTNCASTSRMGPERPSCFAPCKIA